MLSRNASFYYLKTNVSKYKLRKKTKIKAPWSLRKHLDNQANEHKIKLEKQSIDQAERYKSVLEKQSKDIAERHNRLEVSRLNAGDLIEFKNGVSSNWGVYMGDNTVALLTSDKHKRVSEKVSSKSSPSSSNQRSTEVHLHDVFVVAGDNNVVGNNLLDEEMRPLPRSEIMMRVADCLCDADILHFQNSKEFVIWCRYGYTPATRNDYLTLLYFKRFTVLLCIVLLVSYLYCVSLTFSGTRNWQLMLTLLQYYLDSPHVVDEFYHNASPQVFKNCVDDFISQEATFDVNELYKYPQNSNLSFSCH